MNNIYYDPIAEALNMRSIYEVCPNFNLNDTDNVEENHFDSRAYFDWTGHNHTKESKELCRLSKLGPLNPAYGKPSHPNQKKALSKTMKGVPKSLAQKEKMREAKLGIKKSESHKYNMSEAHKQHLAKKIECPHCKKLCSKNHWATQRFHFDNCKPVIIND